MSDLEVMGLGLSAIGVVAFVASMFRFKRVAKRLKKLQEKN